ncbi:MAG: hypothetical protein K6D90_05660 [Lachnospiraceae bacterium]|nr:hypothetical protein [Lachnospiraceae bacterium]
MTACLAAFCAVSLCGCKKEQETEKQITSASQLNDPSYRLLKNSVSDITHSYAPGEELTNTVKITIS